MTRDIELGEPEFRRLVGGQALVIDSVRITLKPTIGWVKLVRAILDAIAPPSASAGGPPDPPQAREFLPLSQQPRRTR